MFDELIEEFGSAVRTMAQGRHKRLRMDMDDLEQIGWLNILQEVRNFDPRIGGFRNFILSRAWFGMLDAAKYQHHHSSIEELTLAPVCYPFPHIAAYVDVHALLSTLTLYQREAVVLKYLFGMTESEIARRLAVSIAVARNRADTGMRSLRRKVAA